MPYNLTISEASIDLDILVESLQLEQAMKQLPSANCFRLQYFNAIE